MDTQVQTPNASEQLEATSHSGKDLPEEQAGHISCPPCRGGELLDTLRDWVKPS